MSTSIILVGCENHDRNTYENKQITKVETTKENTTTSNTLDETTTIEETTTMMQQTTTLEEITTMMQQTTTLERITTTKQPKPTIEKKEETATMEQITTIKQPETTTVQTVMTDDQVIDYIRKVGNKMTECSESIVEGAKDGFITVVDFLFYNGEIGGRTFDSLTESAKSTILGIYDNISTYLEEKWPIWKEAIGEKYQDITELWNDKKDDLSQLLEKGKQKVKNWYENFREENE